MAKKFFDTTVLDKLRNGEKVCAAWNQLGSNLSAEILAEAGFEVLIIDMEHAHTTLPDLITMVQATKGTDCAPFVRVPWNDMVWCKQVLDTGVYGIHVPYVSTKEEAENAVKYCKYPMQGVRGIAGSHRAVNYGMSKEDYFPRANKDVMVIIAIETPKGVANIREIVSVEGVDGIFIGPMDLATSMGHLANPAHPEVQEAIRQIEEVVLPSDKFLATLAPNAEAAKKFYDKGYRLVYMMSDVGCLVKTAQDNVKAFKEYLEKGE